VGVARADEPLPSLDVERYRAFLADGMHGEMDWLAANAEVRERLDTEEILEGAKSIICVARRYGRRKDEEHDPEIARLIARYARGRDYHGGLRRKLRALAAFLRRLGTAESPVRARPIVDDAPVLERAWAVRAGLGFIGKNGMLIVPGQGSFVLLGEVVTTLALTPDRERGGVPLSERCGHCTRCLDACPTEAFAKPFVLDPRKCVSYLTIELRTPIKAPLREQIGERLFGCDDCQSVCPFNDGVKSTAVLTTDAFSPHARWAETRLQDFLDSSPEAWAKIREGSPVSRATADGLARNAAIVLGNRGRAEDIPGLEQVARDHPSAMVREAADWAAQRIRERDMVRRPSRRADEDEDKA
jgi:epoxyqueuosine reductase